MNNIIKNIRNFVLGVYMTWFVLFMFGLFMGGLMLILNNSRSTYSWELFGYGIACWSLFGGIIGVLTDGFES